MYLPVKTAELSRTEMIAWRGRLIIARLMEKMEQVLHMNPQTPEEVDAREKMIQQFFGRNQSFAKMLIELTELSIKLEKLAVSEERVEMTRKLSKADYAILRGYAARVKKK